MNKHTPGPWTRGDGYRIGKGHAICSGPQIVAVVLGDGYPIGEGPGPTSEANCNLIAAAPDLLAALRDVLRDYDDARELIRGDRPDDTPSQLAARAAIAKAEGRDE